MWQNLLAAGLAAAQMALGALGLNHTQLPKDINASYIIHACGEIDGKVLTNSKEALEKAYNDGNRLIEIDFNFTYALEAVCVHDFNPAVFPEYKKGIRPTLRQFMATKIYDTYTPMDFTDVVEFMREHGDLYVVSDVKEYNAYFANMIKESAPDMMDRFIVQVYNEEQYYEVSQLGFDKIIFTLYLLEWEKKIDTDYLVEFAKNNSLFAYTFPYELCDMGNYVERMKEAGVPLYVHTLNDKEMIQKYLDMGVDGVYTDNTENG